MPINRDEISWDETPKSTKITPSEVKWDSPAPQNQDEESTLGTSAGFISGNLIKGLASAAGIPVDAAANIINLGIAGYGTAKGAMGGKDLPETIDKPVGGSEWLKSKIPESLTKYSSPTSTPQRYMAAALQSIPASLATPGTAAQIPAKALAGITSGVGSEVARDIGGDEWAAVGAMTPSIGAVKRMSATPSKAERAATSRKEALYEKAKELGRPILPSEMKIDKGQVRLEEEINKELNVGRRVPPGTEITPESMARYRSTFEKEYADLINSPELSNGVVPNKKFTDTIEKMGGDIASLRGTMRGTFASSKPTEELLRSDFGYGGEYPMNPIPPDIALRSIRKLRNDATSNLRSDKPEQVELGKNQRKIAMALEDLIEDNIAASGLPSSKELLDSVKTARTMIAKSYDIESSLDKTSRKLSGAKLSQLMTSGSPLSGKLKKIAEVSGEFPMSTAPEKSEDFFTHKVSPWAAEHPKVVAGNVISRALNHIKESKPYQMTVDPKMKISPEQERQIRLQAALQAMQGGR